MEQTPLFSYLILAGLGIGLMLSGGLIVSRFEPTKRRPVPWSGWNTFGLLIFYVLAQFVAVQLFISSYAAMSGEEISREELQGLFNSEQDDVEYSDGLRQMSYLLVVNNVASIGCMLVGIALLYSSSRATSRDLGLNWSEIMADIRLGVGGFMLGAPPILAVQGLLRTLYKEDVREHVIERMMKAAESLPGGELAWIMFVLAMSASIVAPIVEEFLFRLVFQGWLEARLPQLFGERPTFPEPEYEGPIPSDVSSTSDDGGSDSLSDAPVESSNDNPYVSPAAASHSPADDGFVGDATGGTPTMRLGWMLPIVFTSVLFALAHFTQWPDPVPLFLFSLVLGYLYQRSHRLLPSIVAHFCLNTFSLSMMWLAFVVGPAK